MIVDLHLQADTGDLDLAAQALLEAADRRRRTGIKASSELDADLRKGVDVDAQARLVVTILAEADTLETWAIRIRGAVEGILAGPPSASPASPAVSAALAAAQRAVEAAKGQRAPEHQPTLVELADAHNAALAGNGAQPASVAPQMVDGRPVWVAVEAYTDDDDELPNAEDAAGVAGEPATIPQPGPGSPPAFNVDLTRP